MSTTRGILLLRALVTIGTLAPNTVTVKQIAERIESSVSYLEQVMAKGKAAGVVRSTRGPGGGYLGVDRTVTAAEVFALFSEPEELPGDAVGSMLTVLNEQFQHALAGVTVADLVAAQGMEKPLRAPSISLAFEPSQPRLMPNPGTPNSVFALGGLPTSSNEAEA